MDISKLKADEITDDNFREIAVEVLHKQAEYCASYLREEVGRWDASFISDDGTDYVQTALDATEILMRIAYEGKTQDLRDFLFTPREEYYAWEERDPTRFAHMPLHAIDSAGGLHPELSQLSSSHDEED